MSCHSDCHQCTAAHSNDNPLPLLSSCGLNTGYYQLRVKIQKQTLVRIVWREINGSEHNLSTHCSTHCTCNYDLPELKWKLLREHFFLCVVTGDRFAPYTSRSSTHKAYYTATLVNMQIFKSLPAQKNKTNHKQQIMATYLHCLPWGQEVVTVHPVSCFLRKL